MGYEIHNKANSKAERTASVQSVPLGGPVGGSASLKKPEPRWSCLSQGAVRGQRIFSCFCVASIQRIGSRPLSHPEISLIGRIGYAHFRSSPTLSTSFFAKALDGKTEL